MNDSPSSADERPSKSQRKREMHARQDLGRQLTELTDAQRGRLALPEALLEAIAQYDRTTGHESRRRQMQYIGKLMRDCDAEAIRAGVAELTGHSRASVARMHRAERLRDRMLEDDAAINEFLAGGPQVDAQWLRAKVRAARQEHVAAKPPRHARELYRWLHEQLESAVEP